MAILRQGIATYEEVLPALLETHRNRFVLIKGDEVVGVFESDEAALRHAAARFGLGPYLVRRIHEERPIESAPAFTLGILTRAV